MASCCEGAGPGASPGGDTSFKSLRGVIGSISGFYPVGARSLLAGGMKC